MEEREIILTQLSMLDREDFESMRENIIEEYFADGEQIANPSPAAAANSGMVNNAPTMMIQPEQRKYCQCGRDLVRCEGPMLCPKGEDIVSIEKIPCQLKELCGQGKATVDLNGYYACQNVFECQWAIHIECYGN